MADLTSENDRGRAVDNVRCPVGDNFLYDFKGALRAPRRAWQLALTRRRATLALDPTRRRSARQRADVHLANHRGPRSLLPL